MTNEKQGVSAWLRGIVDESYGKESRPLCPGIVDTFFGVKCREMHTCGSCILEMFTEIAYRIDAERSLPEGIEWPRFEDGELVKVGDEVEFEGEAAKVLDVAFSAERFSLGVDTATASRRVYCDLGESVNRPAPKVLDADGVPIKVGDTVYFVDGNGRALIVERIDANGGKPAVDLVYTGERIHWYFANPEKLTHERPDSWEKLEEDMMRGTSCRYFGGVESALECWDCPHGTEQTGTPCWKNERIDILKRAKKLAGIEKEARND